MKSNCLFEAIKAKIKDPKNVKIHRFPITLNNNQLHFYWINESENRFWHYSLPNSKAFCNPLFDGKIKSMNNIFFEEKMYKKMNELKWSYDKQIKMAKKLGFRNPEPFEMDRD
jgi:hypothetical protein